MNSSLDFRVSDMKNPIFALRPKEETPSAQHFPWVLAAVLCVVIVAVTLS